MVPAAATPEDRADFLRARAQAAAVVWLVGPDGDPGLADRLGAPGLADRAEGPPAVMTGSWDLRGARLLDLVAVMDRLRSPGGCPWDAEQTHASLVRYCLEEAYEVAEAIESGDRQAMREELGDLLLQVVYHAQMAEEAGAFAFPDVVEAITNASGAAPTEMRVDGGIAEENFLAHRRIEDLLVRVLEAQAKARRAAAVIVPLSASA